MVNTYILFTYIYLNYNDKQEKYKKGGDGIGISTQKSKLKLLKQHGYKKQSFQKFTYNIVKFKILKLWKISDLTLLYP